MFIKNLRIFIPFILITINFTQTEATKCGGFTCEGNSECKYNKVEDKLECTCEEGFVANITGKIHQCYQATSSNMKQQCLRNGDKCGPQDVCNQDLICINTNFVELHNCSGSEKRCLERCCHANEDCVDGKCITRPTFLSIECPGYLKCSDKCCAANEVCSAENVCVLRANQNESGMAVECVASQKCQDKCCQENEVCENDNKCVLKTSGIEPCPESQKCQDTCCNMMEICDEDKCVAMEECPPEQTCLDMCCKETEKCSQDYECVAEENLDHENSFDCSANQRCLHICCGKNEVCSENNECVENVLAANHLCLESQKCLDKCCPPTQFCSKAFECQDKVPPSATDEISATLANSTSVLRKCPLQKQCLNTCCQEEEKCSRFNECIPIDTIECIETDICGDKCCPINAICNEDHECVAFIEGEWLSGDRCPQKQQCLDKCCLPQEVCNELNECVARIIKKELLNYETLPPASSVTESSFDATVQLIGLKNHEQTQHNCDEDYFECQNKCCNRGQTCSSTGECLDQIEENFAAIDCVFGLNCVDNESVTGTKTSLAYTLIGLGCLVMVLSFALFKVYAFRRANRVLY